MVSLEKNVKKIYVRKLIIVRTIKLSISMHALVFIVRTMNMVHLFELHIKLCVHHLII